MVEFYDPVQQITLSYYLAKDLRRKWDKLRKGELKKKDEDRVYIVDGRERLGKSVFTFQQAKYIDPSFSLDRVCFTPDEFLEAIRTAKQGQVVVFDEAFRGLSSRASQSKTNKKIVQAMMEVGQRNLIIFIVLPTIFLLDMYAAVLRSNALLHVYKDNKGLRCFKIYNYQKKSFLYQTGKKKGFSYAIPKVRVHGRFYDKYAINEASYRKKKGDSFGETEIMKEEEESKARIERSILLEMAYQFFKQLGKQKRKGLKAPFEFAQLLEQNNIFMGEDNIRGNRRTLKIRDIDIITEFK